MSQLWNILSGIGNTNWIQWGQDLFQQCKDILEDTELTSDFKVVGKKIRVTVRASTANPIKADKIERIKAILAAAEKQHPTIFNYIEVVLETKMTRLMLTDGK